MAALASDVQAFIDSDVGQGLVTDPEVWFRVAALEGGYLYVSPNVTDFLGFTPDELMALEMHSLMHPDDLGAAATAFEAIKDGPINAVYRVKHKDGGYVWMNSYLQRMDTFIVVVGREVPERLQGLAWQHVDPIL